MTITVLKSWLASRSRRAKVTTIVLHATAGSSLAGALSALKSRELSYHYLIEKDGKLTKAVPYTREAWHAGKSLGPEGPNVNRYSIGISMVNLNNGIDPYPQAQIDACRDLVCELAGALPDLKWLTSHYAISPGRKTDPRGFPSLPIAKAAGLKPWGLKI